MTNPLVRYNNSDFFYPGDAFVYTPFVDGETLYLNVPEGAGAVAFRYFNDGGSVAVEDECQVWKNTLSKTVYASAGTQAALMDKYTTDASLTGYTAVGGTAPQVNFNYSKVGLPWTQDTLLNMISGQDYNGVFHVTDSAGSTSTVTIAYTAAGNETIATLVSLIGFNGLVGAAVTAAGLASGNLVVYSTDASAIGGLAALTYTPDASIDLFLTIHPGGSSKSGATVNVHATGPVAAPLTGATINVNGTNVDLSNFDTNGLSTVGTFNAALAAFCTTAGSPITIKCTTKLTAYLGGESPFEVPAGSILVTSGIPTDTGGTPSNITMTSPSAYDTVANFNSYAGEDDGVVLGFKDVWLNPVGLTLNSSDSYVAAFPRGNTVIGVQWFTANQNANVSA